MTLPYHLQRAMELADRINREIGLVKNDRHRGYHLQKPGATHIGFVRFNIARESAGKYTVYAYWKFDDPQKKFENQTKGKPNQAWFCVVSPDDEDLIRYVITVLESSYDYK